MYIEIKGSNTKETKYYISNGVKYKKISEKDFKKKEIEIEKNLSKKLNKLLKEIEKQKRNNKINPF